MGNIFREARGQQIAALLTLVFLYLRGPRKKLRTDVARFSNQSLDHLRLVKQGDLFFPFKSTANWVSMLREHSSILA